MSDSLARWRLARAAARLAVQARHALPPLVLFTDDDRLADPLAADSGADGVHLPEARLGEAAAWRARRRSFLITGSVHSLGALAKANWIDAVFLSPVFPTKSHPGRVALTAVRANAIARGARLPVYALGGVEACNAGRLSGFAGIAAIGALDV